MGLHLWKNREQFIWATVSIYFRMRAVTHTKYLFLSSDFKVSTDRRLIFRHLHSISWSTAYAIWSKWFFIWGLHKLYRNVGLDFLVVKCFSNVYANTTITILIHPSWNLPWREEAAMAESLETSTVTRCHKIKSDV